MKSTSTRRIAKMSYRVGGRAKRLTLDEALAKAKAIYEKTGVIASIERA